MSGYMKSEGMNLLPISLNNEDKVTIWRLMEKTNLDARKSRNMSWYDDTRTTDKHNAEYLKRLSSLRDSLVNQEQTNLAQAIDRLRGKEINKDSQQKHKIKTSLDFSDGNNRKFITTLEKFKQSRPKKFPPELYPLEGKQLIEPQPSRTPQFSEKSGSATSVARSTEDTIVRSNLQRLIAPITPTSSIPNIGRKSQKTKQQLVLESSPIHRKKSCLSADNSDKNPFKHVHKGGRVRKVIKPDLDDIDLSPKAVKCEKGDNDRLDIDKLKEYICVYYLPSNTPTCQDELDSEEGENKSYLSNDDRNEQQSDKDRHIDLNVRYVDDDNSRFPNEQYRYKAGYFGASQRVPEKKPMIHPITGKALVTNMDDIRKHRLRKLHLGPSINNPEQDSITTVNDKNDKDHGNRKQIIVDMPAIVFNSPTPEVTDIELRATLLAKAYKQNELRQRELKNLLDDVKELNKRSDDLTENIPIEGPPV